MNKQELIQSLKHAEEQLLTGIKQSDQLTEKEKEMLFTLYTYMKYSVEIKQMQKKHAEYTLANQRQLERNDKLQKEIAELQVIIDNEERKKQEQIRLKQQRKMQRYSEKEDLKAEIKCLERQNEYIQQEIVKRSNELEKLKFDLLAKKEPVQRRMNYANDMEEYLIQTQEDQTYLELEKGKMDHLYDYYVNSEIDDYLDDSFETHSKQQEFNFLDDI